MKSMLCGNVKTRWKWSNFDSSTNEDFNEDNYTVVERIRRLRSNGRHEEANELLRKNYSKNEITHKNYDE